MKNNVLSIERLGRLMILSIKRNLVQALVFELALIVLLVSFLNFFNHKNDIVNILYFITISFALIYISIGRISYFGASSEEQFILQPYSIVEKFIVNIIGRLFVFILLLFPTFYITIDHLQGIKEFIAINPYYYYDLTLNNELILRCFHLSLIVASICTVGALSFKKNIILKNALILLFIASIVIGLFFLSEMIITKFLKQKTESVGINFSNMKFLSQILNYKLSVGFSIFMLLISFFKLKELEA